MTFLTRANEALETLDIKPNDCINETALRAIHRAARATVWPKTDGVDRAIRQLRRKGVSQLDCASYIEKLSWAMALSPETAA